MKDLTWKETKLLQASAIIALAYSFLFQFFITKAFLSGNWRITLDFHAAGEGWLEMLIIFPASIIISAWFFGFANELK